MTLNLEKYERVLEENRRRVEAALSFEEPDRVPVQINVQGAYYAWLFGVPLRDYYTDLKLMAEVQLKGLEWRLSWLRDDVTSVAITLDLGAVAEGIVFGCRIVMPDYSDLGGARGSCRR